jgi:hypothetical protein
MTIADWASIRYQPDQFAAWLVDQGLDGTWRR